MLEWVMNLVQKGQGQSRILDSQGQLTTDPRANLLREGANLLREDLRKLLKIAPKMELLFDNCFSFGGRHELHELDPHVTPLMFA